MWFLSKWQSTKSKISILIVLDILFNEELIHFFSNWDIFSIIVVLFNTTTFVINQYYTMFNIFTVFISFFLQCIKSKKLSCLKNMYCCFSVSNNQWLYFKQNLFVSFPLSVLRVFKTIIIFNSFNYIFHANFLDMSKKEKKGTN